MKLTSEIIRKAHKMTREIKEEFPSVDYKFQFGLCMSYLIEEEKKGEKKLTAYEKFLLEKQKNEVKTVKSMEDKIIEKLEEICKENGWEADYNIWTKKDDEGKILYSRKYFKAIWYVGNKHNRKRREKGFGFWDYLNNEYSLEHKTVKQYNVYEY